MSFQEMVDKKEVNESKIRFGQKEILSIMEGVEIAIFNKIGIQYTPNEWHDFLLNRVIKGFVFESNVSAYPCVLKIDERDVTCENINDFKKEVDRILKTESFWMIVKDFEGSIK